MAMDPRLLWVVAAIRFRVGTTHLPAANRRPSTVQPARALVIGILLTVATAVLVSAQGFGRGWGACSSNWDADDYFVSPFFAGNPTYDGRVTFARIKYRGAYECGRE